MGLTSEVLQQDACLLELCRENVAVVGVAGEGARADHQAALVGDGDAGLDAELVGLAGFALADALDLRCVQRVELVLVLGLLVRMRSARSSKVFRWAMALGRFAGRACQFALDLAQHDAQNRALALDGTAQALELLGVGVAAGLAAQFLAFLGEGLLETMPARLAACTTLCRAISSRRLSTGWAMAFSCTVVSTMTRSNSAGRTALVCTAVSMVALSSCSRPASPMAARKRPIWVASQGSVGS